MNINEQVEYLMQGADFGDAAIADNMADELRQRLIECEKTGKPLRVYCGYDPTSTDLHPDIPSPCASSASSRNSGMRCCL